MVIMLALGKSTIVLLCVMVVIATVILWSKTRPPVLDSASLPPVMRRGIYWWFFLTVLFALATLAYLALRNTLGIPRHGWYRYVPIVLSLVPLLIINPWYMLRMARLRRVLSESGECLCIHCTYNLTGLNPTGNCPECGHAFDMQANAAMWRAVAQKGDSATAEHQADQ